MSIGRLPQITNYSSTDWVYIFVGPLGGSPAWKATPVSNFFGKIPAGVPIGFGATAYDYWGIRQSWSTGSPASGGSCGGIRSSVTVNWDTDNNNGAKGIQTTVSLLNGTPIGGYPTSDLMAVYGFASNYGTNTELDKILGASFEARQYGGDVGEIYGGMFQTSNSTRISGNTTKITGIYADAYTTPGVAGTFSVGTLYGAELRTFGKSNYAADVIDITTAYGLFSSVYNQQFPASTITIGDLYNVYLTPYRPGGYAPNEDGAITNYYGLRIVDPVDLNATNKWNIYSEGRHYFHQPTADEAEPVMLLEQADLSEGFIDFLGTSAASAVGPISSWTTGATIQGFVRVEINGAAFWMPYYDAPTS